MTAVNWRHFLGKTYIPLSKCWAWNTQQNSNIKHNSKTNIKLLSKTQWFIFQMSFWIPYIVSLKNRPQNLLSKIRFELPFRISLGTKEGHFMSYFLMSRMNQSMIQLIGPFRSFFSPFPPVAAARSLFMVPARAHCQSKKE